MDRLTPRQRDCLLLACDGYSAKEAAPRLGLSYGSVRSYLAAAYVVLRVRNRTEACVALLRAEEHDPTRAVAVAPKAWLLRQPGRAG